MIELGNIEGPAWDGIEQTPATDWRKIVPEMKYYNRLICIGKDKWPIEGYIGKPFKTFFRRLILTRRIITYRQWLKEGGCTIKFI